MAIALFRPVYSGNNPDYRQEFGSKYSDALKYIIEQSEWIPYFKDHHIDPAFAVAVVFPEIVRYSVISDKIEIAGLQTLYVQYGAAYADFSIGRFQMKPTFAHAVEKDYYSFRKKIFKDISCKFDTADTPEARIARLKRLSTEEGQMTYLMLFIRIMEYRCKSFNWNSEEDKLRYFSTAYNFGYQKSKDNIVADMSRKSFHTGIFFGKYVKKYCYADISCDFLKNFKRIF